METSPSRTSYRLVSTAFLSIPLPIVALPCGSRSINSTFFFSIAKAAARLIAVVVLPTPPFWFAIHKTWAPIGVFFLLMRFLVRQPDQATLCIHFGYLQRVNFCHPPRCGFLQRVNFLKRLAPFHGQHVATVRDMPAPEFGEIFQRRKGTGN